VIDVGVGQDDLVDRAGVVRRLAVALKGFLALALEQAAVQQDAVAVDFEEVLRAGDRPRRTVERDSHDLLPLAWCDAGPASTRPRAARCRARRAR